MKIFLLLCLFSLALSQATGTEVLDWLHFQDLLKSKADSKTWQQLGNVLDKLPAPLQKRARSYLETKKTWITEELDKKIAALKDKGVPQILIDELIEKRRYLTDLWFPTTTTTKAPNFSFLKKLYGRFFG